MNTGCRNTDEAAEYLEAEARWEESERFKAKYREEAEVTPELSTCDECGEELHQSEFSLVNVCKGCEEWGEYIDQTTFVSESGNYYKV